jgi:hypothetical protein
MPKLAALRGDVCFAPSAGQRVRFARPDLWLGPWVVAAPRGDSPVLAAEHKARVYRPQGWLSPVLLADGRIEGVWRHERKGRRLALQIEAFGDPGEAVRAGAAAEAARLAAHLGAAELDVSWA